MATREEDIETLMNVLQRCRELIVMPESNFLWTSWRDATHALGEMDYYLSLLASDEIPKFALQAVFAPTGPMQELSIDSGWGDEFLILANQVDLTLGDN